MKPCSKIQQTAEPVSNLLPNICRGFTASIKHNKLLSSITKSLKIKEEAESQVIMLIMLKVSTERILVLSNLRRAKTEDSSNVKQ